MTAYIIRRIFIGLMILLLVTMMVFLLVRLLPGDPLMVYMGNFTGTGQQNIMTPEQHDALMKIYGLDRSLPVQFWDWLTDVFRGDLGKSIGIGQPISKLIADVLPRTAYIGTLMFIIGTFGGIFLGIYCALRRGSWMDNTLTTIANIGMTVPTTWVNFHSVS